MSKTCQARLGAYSSLTRTNNEIIQVYFYGLTLVTLSTTKIGGRDISLMV